VLRCIYQVRSVIKVVVSIRYLLGRAREGCDWEGKACEVSRTQRKGVGGNRPTARG
jgi:hypothetical protein